MKKTFPHLFIALMALSVGYYSIITIRDLSEPFIEMSISGAEQMKELLSNKENTIQTLTIEQRESWIANLSEPELQAAGIIFMRDLASILAGVLFLSYAIQSFYRAYKCITKQCY